MDTGELELDQAVVVHALARTRPLLRRAPITLSYIVLSVVALAVWLVVRPPSPMIAFNSHYYVENLEYSPDGKLLASVSSDGRLRIWNAETGTLISASVVEEGVSLSGAAISEVAFSSDGANVATAGRGGEIKLWETSSGRLLRTLIAETDSVYAIRFSPNGRILASAGSGKTIRLWDVASGEPVKVLQGHKDSINALAFSPDGAALASGSDDAMIIIWSVAKNAISEIISIPPKNAASRPAGVLSLSFSPDGDSLASASSDELVRIWAASTGEVEQSFDPGGDCSKLAFEPNRGNLATNGNKVRIWELTSTSATVVKTLPTATSIALSPNGRRLASASYSAFSGPNINVWDIDR